MSAAIVFSLWSQSLSQLMTDGIDASPKSSNQILNVILNEYFGDGTMLQVEARTATLSHIFEDKSFVHSTLRRVTFRGCETSTQPFWLRSEHRSLSCRFPCQMCCKRVGTIYLIALNVLPRLLLNDFGYIFFAPYFQCCVKTRGVTRGKGGANFPSAESQCGRRIIIGAPNHCVVHWMTARGAEKTQQCRQYFLQYSTFASERPQIQTRGRQTSFLSRAAFNLVAPLVSTVEDIQTEKNKVVKASNEDEDLISGSSQKL